MSFKCVITGTSRGLGRSFYEHFKAKGWEVTGLNSQTSFEQIIQISQGCDLFINNSYADGRQIDFLNQLYSSVGKMIICGSVAAYYPDKKLPVYSYNKKILADRVREIASSDILMLNISAKAYNERNTILKVIDLWLDFPLIKEVSFDPSGAPNE